MFQQAIGRGGRIRKPSAIAAIASPIRQDILDTIETLGGSASVGELAEQLGRPADGLYYHVEVLRRAGLLAVAANGRTRAGRAERRYRIPVPAGTKLELDYRDRPRALRELVAGMLRIARRDFDGGLDRDETVVAGPARELWAARGTGWVDAAGLRRINRLLEELSGELRRPRRGAHDKLVSVCFVLAPLSSRPKRR